MFCCVVSLSIVPYFDEPVGRVKIQTTSKNSQRYYTTKRLIRYMHCIIMHSIVLFVIFMVNRNYNTPNYYVRAGGFLSFIELHQRVQILRSVFVFFVVLVFLFSSINDEISLSSNCFSSFNLYNKLGSIFTSHSDSSSSEK